MTPDFPTPNTIQPEAPSADTCACGHGHAGRADRTRSLARRSRLVSRLVRAAIERELPERPSRGDVKSAAKSVEQRIAAAVSPDELAAANATLDAVIEALGGRDALPAGPRGHGHHHGRLSHRGHRGHREFSGHRGHHGHHRGHRGYSAEEF